MADKKKGALGRVFISYSRKDKRFVKKLNAALDAAGVQAWVDWEGIEIASDWRQRISSAIQESDAFVFVISPDSLKSKVCGEELAQGLQYNKKLIPILHRKRAPGQTVPKEISAKNYVYMRPEDNFKEALAQLIGAIQTDLGWIQQHTKILGQAVEWEAKKKNSSYLLNGTELKDAEAWMANGSTSENRSVLPLQAEFITTSRISSDRRQRFTLFGVSFLLALSIVLSVFAWGARQDAIAAQYAALTNEAIAIQKQQEAEIAQAAAEANEALAEQQTNIARAQRSVAQSQIYQSRPGELDTSTLLAIESWNRIPSFEAEDLIRSNLSLYPLPVARMKQDGGIFNIAWSPDYSVFVTGNRSDESNPQARNEACVWRGDTGEMAYCVQHDDDVNDALFSPDGKYLITGSADKTARFWDAATGSPLERFDYGGAVLDLETSERVLAIAREDNHLTLYYYNRPDLKPIDYEYVYKVNFVKQPVAIGSAKFSPDGNYLAFSTSRGTIEFWQARNNFFYHGPKHEGSEYLALAFSPDNLWLASGGSDSLSRLTKRDGTFQYSIPHGDWVEDVAFGPDPTWYVTVSDDNKVRVLETASGDEKIRMSHTDFIQKVKVSPDGQWIAATGYDKVVRIWDSASGSLALEFALQANGSALSFNQDGTRIIAADEAGNIFLQDISYLSARLNLIEFPEFLHEAHFTPDGAALLVNSDDYTVRKIPASEITTNRDGSLGETIFTASNLTYNMAISSDANWVAVVEKDNVNPQRNQASLFSMDGRSVLPLDHGGEVTGVGFSYDNKYVLTSGKNGYVAFWLNGSSDKVFDLELQEPVYSLATNPANPLIAAGLKDKTSIWDSTTKKIISDLPQAGNIVAIAFSNDAQWLATGSSEGTIAIWQFDGASFQRAGDDLRANGTLNGLAFSPNGAWLAGGSTTGFAHIWNRADLQEHTRIRHSDPVTSVVFSPDGAQLITVSRKNMQVWDLTALRYSPQNTLVQFACQHLTANFSRNQWTAFFGSAEYTLPCEGLPEGN
jgi:WD40 repeat protein